MNRFSPIALAMACATMFASPAHAAARTTADTYIAANGVVVMTTYATGVLGNDTSTISPTIQLTATLVTAPTHGTLTLNTDGTFSYFAAIGYVGNDTFTYRASDGSGTQNGTVTISIPVRVNDDSYATSGSSQLIVLAPGVLTNDKTSAGTLSMSIATWPVYGSVTPNGTDGGFTY